MKADTAKPPSEADAKSAKAGEPAAAPKKKKKIRLTKAAKIADLEQQTAELEDKNLRLRAEFDNFRKRTSRDLNDSRILGTLNTLEAMLPVFDYFQMAMASIRTTTDLETVKQGMDMIAGEFERSFENLGVERIPTEGQPFDPALHEAVSTEPSEETPEGGIIREWKAGYKFGERILRAPVVVVSSGAPEADEDAKEEQ